MSLLPVLFLSQLHMPMMPGSPLISRQPLTPRQHYNQVEFRSLLIHQDVTVGGCVCARADHAVPSVRGRPEASCIRRAVDPAQPPLNL